MPEQKKGRAAYGLAKDLYPIAYLLPKAVEKRTGLLIPVTVYVQDPAVARDNPKLGLKKIEVNWEPTLMDGPTSARFAVVDYDGDSDELIDPVRWDHVGRCFVAPDGSSLDEVDPQRNLYFHQVNVWAIAHYILGFFEDSTVLGRRVPWAFEGNRLILVPHAGYDENAFYDRHSKSLQFYYCGTSEQPVYTCLSHDIIAHELGHAILDGVRPFYYEASSVQTMAFHEFVADLTAIVTALRNNDLRRAVAAEVGADLSQANILAALADEFGAYTMGRPYLRSALNELTMEKIEGDDRPHFCSQVLTRAMYQILIRIAAGYMERNRDPERRVEVTPPQALWWAADRIRRLAFQPLDLLPPVDVQFIDYVRAVLQTYDRANPTDPHGYRKIMTDVFHDLGFCKQGKENCAKNPHACDLERRSLPPKLSFCDVDRVTMSRAEAYHYLNDNRSHLGIPVHQDLIVADMYETNKIGRPITGMPRLRLPREIVLEYVWHEDVELGDPRFGPLEGETTSLLCGGTLVFDERGNLLSWFCKMGTEKGQYAAEGGERRRQLEDYAAERAARGLIGLADDGGGAYRVDVGRPVVEGRRVGGRLRLETTPHFRHWGSAEGGNGGR
jgi:hypothetical protein